MRDLGKSLLVMIVNAALSFERAGRSHRCTPAGASVFARRLSILLCLIGMVEKGMAVAGAASSVGVIHHPGHVPALLWGPARFSSMPVDNPKGFKDQKTNSCVITHLKLAPLNLGTAAILS